MFPGMAPSFSTMIEDPARLCRHGHDRPRVLGIATRLRDDDQSRHVFDLTAALRERGFDTRLVWGSSGTDARAIDPPPWMTHSYLPWLGPEIRPGDDLRALTAIAGIMRRWKPDVVHTHLAKAGALGRVVAQRVGVPVIVHTFSERLWREYRSAMRNATFARIERKLAGRTDALIASTPWLRDELLALGIGRAGQWHVVPADAHVSDLVDLYQDLLADTRPVRSAQPERVSPPMLARHVPA